MLFDEKNFPQKAEAIFSWLQSYLRISQDKRLSIGKMGNILRLSSKKAEQWRVRLARLEAEGNVEAAIDIWEESTAFRSSARIAHMALGRIT